MINVSCNLCGADDYRVVYHSTVEGAEPTVSDYTSTVNKYGLSNRIVSCRRCGLMYANPRDAGIKSFYREVVDNEYIESWDERSATFRNHLKALKPYRKGVPRLLDIGCYAGSFPQAAQDAGYIVTGVEPSRWAADFAKNRTRADILLGSWDEVCLPESHFDMATMWDVVEHLEDPSGAFKKIHGWLKKGGITAVTTHNIKCLAAKVLGKNYPWLMRFHLYHFEPRTLSAMMRKSNLTPVLIKYYTKTISLKYILGRLGIRPRGEFFKNFRFSVNTGDFFMIIGRKE